MAGIPLRTLELVECQIVAGIEEVVAMQFAVDTLAELVNSKFEE